MGDNIPRTEAAFLAGGGEMGERTRAFDWSKTPVGPLALWPQSLKTLVRTMLDSRYAMWLGWGPDFTFFYNDAYAKMSLGPKHPWALGKSAREVWSEIWGDIGPRAESVIRTGQATWDEGLLLFLERQGFPEETYHTFSYSPVPDDTGGEGGMLCVVTEDTERTIGERRLKTLRELAARTNDVAKSVEEACQIATRTLIGNSHDLPFVVLYLLSDDGRRARLVGQTGLGPDSPACPAEVDLDRSSWPFRQVAESGNAVVVDDLRERFGPLPGGAWPEPTLRAVVLPMAKPGQARPTGFVVAGVSPRLVFNEGYRGFFDLLAGHVATAVANARAYEEERQRAEKLAELDRAKTAFFSNVSHEFRTPLTLMLGPVEDALAGSDGSLLPSQRERLEVVHRNGLRLQRLVNSLLDFSRIEAGRVRAAYEPTDLAEFTADLASNFRSACEKAGLRLTVDCPPLAEPVFVDRSMWEKVVLNLLSNAFKFTFEGEIAVSMRQTEHTVELRVRDTGTGIPAEEMPRLFKRFHRVENARGRTHEGSGIGLALVQELLKLHGGSITAESESGVGTTFAVTIPLGADHLPRERVGTGGTTAATTGASPFVEETLRWLPDGGGPDELGPGLPEQPNDLSAPPLRPDAERPRVLVADDNADMRRYVQRLLSGAYTVEAVADGAAALDAVRRDRPALVLADVMMPRLDGFGLLRELRADPRTASLPVILLSARAGQESRVEGVAAGADDYLVKPFSARELLARVTGQVQMARIRREAGEALRAQREELREAQRVAHVGSWRWDAATDVTTGSDELYRIYGLDPATQAFPDFKAQDGTLYPHGEWERLDRAIGEAVRTGMGYQLDVRAFRHGEPIWVTARSEAVRDATGGVVGLRGTVQDITERKRAEELLRQGEEHLRAVVETTPACIKVVAADGTLVSMNSAGLAMVEAERPENVQGGCVYGLVCAEYRDAFREFNERVCRGEAGTLEFEIEGLRGTRRVMETHAAPLRGPDGSLRQLAITHDITARKRAERELAEAHEFLHSSLDALSSHIAVLDEDGVILAVNEAWRRFADENQYTGHDHGVGANYIQACEPGGSEGGIVAGLQGVLTGRLPYFEFEYPCHAPTEQRWFVMRATRFRSPGSVRVVVAHQDVTKRKLAEDALRDADRRKDEFLATLAHELRNPLAPIRNGLQIMRLSNGEREAVEQARTMMERQLGQMVRLVDDLLDLSRITRGKIELRKERVELARVIQQAVETSRPLIEQAGHDLTITMPSGPGHVDADVTRLAQVFSNLLNNAAKYTERGGRVELAVRRQGGEVVVSVRDNGVGIPADMLPRVFEMFTQVDRHLERSQGGLGIGLSIVKKLVEMHGGSVGVSSDGPGTGSEFTVTLPVVLSVAEPIGRDEEPARPSSRRKVLVVDDNVDAAMSLAMMLMLMGNEAKTAHDGLEALDVAEAFRPDLILLDIGMPRLNGYDTAKRIREQAWGKGMVLVALTGWGQEEDRRKSEKAGFDAHMTKPIEPAALEKLVANLRADTA